MKSVSQISNKLKILYLAQKKKNYRNYLKFLSLRNSPILITSKHLRFKQVLELIGKKKKKITK